jgi:hypothetical protein
MDSSKSDKLLLRLRTRSGEVLMEHQNVSSQVEISRRYKGIEFCKIQPPKTCQRCREIDKSRTRRSLMSVSDLNDMILPQAGLNT